MCSQFDFFKISWCSGTSHHGLPDSNVSGVQVVRGVTVGRMMTVIAEEEGLDDRLVHHRGDEGGLGHQRICSCLKHELFCLGVFPGDNGW